MKKLGKVFFCFDALANQFKQFVFFSFFFLSFFFSFKLKNKNSQKERIKQSIKQTRKEMQFALDIGETHLWGARRRGQVRQAAKRSWHGHASRDLASGGLRWCWACAVARGDVRAMLDRGAKKADLLRCAGGRERERRVARAYQQKAAKSDGGHGRKLLRAVGEEADDCRAKRLRRRRARARKWAKLIFAVLCDWACARARLRRRAAAAARRAPRTGRRWCRVNRATPWPPFGAPSTWQQTCASWWATGKRRGVRFGVVRKAPQLVWQKQLKKNLARPMNNTVQFARRTGARLQIGTLATNNNSLTVCFEPVCVWGGRAAFEEFFFFWNFLIWGVLFLLFLYSCICIVIIQFI